jgi:hypothetical protein
MHKLPAPPKRPAGGEVVDFDAALLNARPPDQKVELIAEASILAAAFAPEGRAAQIERLARQLETGLRDLEVGRARARLLAAALRQVARQAA